MPVSTFMVLNILVAVSTALHMEIEPSHDLIAVKWKQVYLRCKVTGAATKPIIEIAKDGVVFRKPPPFPLDWEFGKIFLIRPLFVGKSDGYYECIARDGKNVLKKGIHITVKDEKNLPAGFPKVTDKLRSVYPYYGANFTLSCDHEGNPKPSVTWFLGKKPINMSDPRLKLLPNGNLLVSRTTKADKGHYDCEVSNMFGVRYSDRVVVHPRSPPPLRIIPKFTKTLKDIVLDSEDSVWLSCAATGEPTPQFSWRLNGERIHSRTDGLLHIEKIIKTANYTCEARNIVGSVSSTATVTIRGKPLSPTEPKFVKHTPSSITISWNPSPREIYPITYFVVQHKKEGVNNWSEDVKSRTDRQLTLTKLKPYEFVTFRVIAANTLGKSKPSKSSKFNSGETVPESPAYNLQGKGMSDTSIYATWMPPRKPNGRIEGYKVYYTTDPTFKLSDWDMRHSGSNFTTLTTLEKNGVYYFRVLVYGINGDGPMSTEMAVVRTLKGAPSLPSNLRGNALTSKSVQLYWDPPNYHGNGLDGYEIYYSAPDVRSQMKMVDHTNGVISSKVRGLKPFSNYSFKVAAKSYAGIGPFTPTIKIQTLEDVPTGAPLNARALPRSSTSIEVFWNPPAKKDRNGIITFYNIMYTPVRSATPKVLKVQAGSKSTLLMGLRKFTRYTIWMSAENKAGEGPSTHKFELFTEEDVPDTAPTDIRAQALNSSAISVSWGPPVERSGRIQGYIIYCMPVQENKELIPGVTMPYITMSRGSVNRQTILTKEIKPLQWYRIDVAAYNVKGDGVRSSKVYVKTPRKLPPSPRVIVSQNSSKVYLSWRPRVAGVVGYKIVYGKSLRQYGNVVHKKTMVFPSIVTEQSFKKLARGVWYSFRVSADIQGKGWSSENIQWILTPEYRPSGAPANVKATTESSSSVLLSWEKPEPWKINGKIVRYIINYKRMDKKSKNYWKTYIPIKDEGSMSLIINGLISSSEYFFRIQAATAVGSGPFSVDVSAMTNAEVLPVVKRLQVSEITNNSAYITWGPPENSARFSVHGYRVEYQGTKTFIDENGKTKRINSSSFDQLTSHSYVARNLISDMLYKIQVAVVTSAGIGQTLMQRFRTLQGRPKSVPSPVVAKDQKYKKYIQVKVQRASEMYGPIQLYSLCVVDFGANLPQDIDSLKPADFKEDRRVRRGINASERLFYITANFQPGELPTIFKVGTSSIKDNVANRPLKFMHYYKFFLQSSTRQGISNKHINVRSPFSSIVQLGVAHRSSHFKSQRSVSDNKTWIAIAAVGFVILVIGAIILLIFFRKRRARRHKDDDEELKKPLRGKNMSMKSKLMDPVELHRLTFQTPGMISHPPISVEAFESHVDSLKKDNNNLFVQEYESIEPGQTYTSEASMQQCNHSKNRYTTLCAYDHSRIKLDFKGDLGSDYINANYIDGYCKEKAYIATQGPLQNTVNDFWRMCWEQKASTIVMMTQLEERGRPKCEQYWPSNGLATYGKIRVGMRDQLGLAYYTQRTFEITQLQPGENETREIKQFQFTAWPDPGVPENPAPLLQFIRRVKSAVAPDAGVVVVHCSGGVGKTACYIVVDAMLDKITNEKKVDVYGYVTMLRAQRNFMVQTDLQYIFIHDVIAEAIHSGNTEIPATHLMQHFKKLNEYYNKTNGDTLLEEEFKNIVNATIPYDTSFTSAQHPINKQKNRCQSISPYDQNRVCLQTLRGHEGSDYINASFVDGYRERKAYIACQGPMDETVDDFWRMVIEYSCSIIVMLTNLDEKGKEQCCLYWPKDKSLRYQFYVVDPVSETRMPYYVVREFKVTDARDGESRSIRQFQYLNWPENGVPHNSEGLIELIGQVQRAYNQLNSGGQIVVHSSNGAGRIGVYITACLILGRLRVENVLDLYQTVKTLRLQRPYMVQTVEQYQFCYRVAVDFLKNFDFVV